MALIYNEIDAASLSMVSMSWQHDGIFYAFYYEQYQIYDEDLQLHGFFANTAPTPSYLPELDANEQKLADLITSSLRFISQRLQVSQADYEKLKSSIQGNFNLSDSIQDPLILRCWLCCLTQGLDNAAQVEITNAVAALQGIDLQVLKWFNEVIRLDEQVLPGSMEIKFAYLPALMQAITQENQFEALRSLKDIKAKEFLNHCGHALHYYEMHQPQGQSTHFLAQLLKAPSEFMSHYPLLFSEEHSKNWVDPLQKSANESVARQQEILKKQIASIDFSRSSSFPGYEELAAINQKMQDNPYDAARYRREFVASLTNTVITFKEESYRNLTQAELAFAQKQIDRQFSVHFAAENKILAQKLFQDCLAIENIDEDQTKKITDLIALLAKIDNKSAFNELGQVLGLLIKKSAGQKHLSLEQLTKWLTVLSQAPEMKAGFFPNK